ncbi:MAG: DNA gyrase subunit A, partial [Planctomycetota bacterium]
YVLVDKQGNFGSLDDPPAAMRYTEARMSAAGLEMLVDLEEDTVNWIDNYDQTRKEPMVLPARFPNLVCNGSSGIAVGMATSIPPHNLREVCQALIALIKDPSLSVLDLMQYIQGPDFPTGAVMVGRGGLIQGYTQSKGQIILRGVSHFEDWGNTQAIVMTELPYQVTPHRFFEKLKEGIESEIIKGIRECEDNSDYKGLKLVVVLKRGEDPHVVLNQLYKHTGLQTTFNFNMVALVNHKPCEVNLYQLLFEYLKHRREVLVRRTRFRFQKTQARIHLLEGQLKVLDRISEVIQIIRSSQDTAEAKPKLQQYLGLTEIQADNILQMRLARLTALELQQVQTEFKEQIVFRGELQSILDADQTLQDKGWIAQVFEAGNKLLNLIIADIQEIHDKYGDERRTKIEIDEVLDILDESLIPVEEQVITLSDEGYIKVTGLTNFRSQNKGGVGIKGAETKSESDTIQHMITASSHDHLLFFTNLGRVYVKRTFELPSASRTSKGRAIINYLKLMEKEYVTTILPIKSFDDSCFVMCTQKGVIKKTSAHHYAKIRSGGLIAINLDIGDTLIDVLPVKNEQHILIATAEGKAIRFSEQNIREIGRTARGVRAIRLESEDVVVRMIVANLESSILTVCERGYGKRTQLSEYRSQGRGGKGIINIRTSDRNGKVIGVLPVSDNDDIVMVTEKGTINRISAKNLREIGRVTQGVRLIHLREGDRLVSIARAEHYEIPEGEEVNIVSILPEQADNHDLESPQVSTTASPSSD